MLDGGFHVEILQCGLLSGDDNIDVIATAQTMVGHREQRVCVRGKIDSDNVGFFVYNMVDEAGS